MDDSMERLALERRLHALMEEHRDLDDAIRALQAQGNTDMLRLQRLKKRKLALKDQIRTFEDQLFPDIIA